MFYFCLKDKYGKVCALEGGDVTENFLQGIPPRGVICDAKERGEEDNMIGNVTEKSVRIGGGVEFPKIKLTIFKYLYFN